VSRSAWVISSVTDTTIYFCYDEKQVDNNDYVGYAGDAASQNVWDSNFAAVYHMNQDPSGGVGAILDSTINSNDGTPAGSMTSGDLVDADYGKAIDFDGSNDYIGLGSNALLNSLSPFTVSACVNLSSFDTLYPAICSLKNDKIENLIISFSNQSEYFDITFGSSGTFWPPLRTGSIPIYVATDYIVTITYNGEGYTSQANYGLSLDGAEKILTTAAPYGSYQGESQIGAKGEATHWHGTIAELRISNIDRSSAWIKATNASLTDILSTKGETETIDIPETVEEVEWTPEYTMSSLWLDAADSETITLDGSGNVEQWDDKSGNDNHFSQATASYRPEIGTNGGISQNSTTSYKFLASNPTVNGLYAVVIVSKWYSTAGDYRHLCIAHGDTASSGDLFSTSYGGQLVQDGDGWITGVETSPKNMNRYTTPVIHFFVPSGEAGMGYQTGNGGGFPSRCFYGEHYEIIGLPTAPSTDERQKIEGYLAHKWGLESNLPADHPYKTIAPVTYADKIPTYYFEGTVIDGISQYVERDIRLYRYDTGELMNTTTSVSGSFFITTTHSGTHYITCHDLPYGEYNDLIFGKITPGITYD
jgi:hypothetical protein